jgi:nucleoside-diphosphate-sugar epimerase
MSRYVLTGASGFIGSHLLALFAPGDEVVCAGRTAPDAARCPARVEHVAMDFNDPWNPSRLPARVDTVVHLAQSEHYREFPARARDIFATNVDSTARLLDYARGAGAVRFVLASSGGIYGSGGRAFTEDDVIRPAGSSASTWAPSSARKSWPRATTGCSTSSWAGSFSSTARGSGPGPWCPGWRIAWPTGSPWPWTANAASA